MEPLNPSPPLPRRRVRSMWERASGKVRRLLRFQGLAGYQDKEEDPMPRCLLAYDQRLCILPLLPRAIRQNEWRLLFTTADHGTSLSSFLDRCSGHGPTLVLVRDKNGHVFGAFAGEAWRQKPDPHFHGCGEGFLFSTWVPADVSASGGFRAWRWSGANRHFQCAAIDFLAFGSGSHFGLWLGKSLTFGSTGRSETFHNEALTEHSVSGGLESPHGGASAFEVLELQVWAVGSRDTRRQFGHRG